MCTRYTFSGLLFLLLFIGNIAKAQEKKQVGGDMQLSLQEAVDYALKNSADIKNAQIDIEIAKKKIWETTAIGLPQVSAKFAYQNIFKVPEMTMYGASPVFPIPGDYFTHTHKLDTMKLSLGVKENTTLDITVSQIIFSGEYLVGVQASRTFKLLSEQGVSKAENEIRETVSGTYQLVLITEESKAILDSSLANILKIIDEMDKMYKAGFIEDTDVDQLQLTALNLKNTIASLERQIDVAKNLLKMQMGLTADQNIILKDKLADMLLTVNPDGFSSQSFDAASNINLKLLDTQEKLTKLNLRRYQAQCLPSVVAFYRHQEQGKEPEFNFNPKNILGISIEIPIFASGMRHAKQQQVKLELEKINNTKEKVSQALSVEYSQSLASFNAAIDKYNREKENNTLAKKIYDKTLVKYKKGVSSSLELTQAQNQFLQTQSSFFQSMFEVLSAKNKIERILSGSSNK